MLIAIRVASAAPVVVAWGDNANGQCIVPISATNVVAISAGGFFNLALRSNGSVISWGSESTGLYTVPANATNVMAISAGFGHALVLRSNGTMVVWGDNSIGGATNMPVGLSGIKAIAACGFHSLAVRTNGTVVAWGYNTDGQTNVPPAATNVVGVAGGYASIALRSNGTVVAWGANLTGQANIVPTLTSISAIASGLSHALALRSNGTVVAWGDNFYHQTNVPPGLSNVAFIGCGSYHSFAIESNGTLHVWGRNTHGQSTNLFGFVERPEPFNGIMPAMGGDFHSLALGYLNDDFINRMLLSGSNFVTRISNLNSTTEYGNGEPFHHPDFFTGHTVWFTWTAPASGGVVLTASNLDFTVETPILAVYSGSTLSGLTQLAVNAADSSSFNVARAVFTAVAGQTYQIAFAGDSNFGGGEGTAYLMLKLSPPPVNDAFAGASIVPGNYFAAEGSFIGASRESFEPSHGDPTLGQSLWWNWTAPTNGPSPLSVRLMTDAVSFPPAIGVYTGNTLASLTPVGLAKKTNGMTSEAVFTATPGTTYRIALAGKQHDANSTAPLIGSFHLRLNCRPFALTITNLIAVTNTAPGPNNGSVTFQADARIQNFTTAPSGPLRVFITALSGLSTTLPLDATPVSTISNLGVFPSIPINVAPGQTVQVHITATVPAPITNGLIVNAFGAYASLQESPVTNQWFTLDETLVTFDRWPAIGEIVGPGGGVIRLDPGFVGSGVFNPLASVTPIGPSAVLEGNPASYYGQARYANGFLYNFTNTVWLTTLFSITTNGVFAPGVVFSNTPVTLTAKFSTGGFVYDALTNVMILNLPSPVLRQPQGFGTNFTLRLEGVSNRVHVIEAATNLAPPVVWLPVSTNMLGANGILMITNPIAGNPRRFFRAREVQ